MIAVLISPHPVALCTVFFGAGAFLELSRALVVGVRRPHTADEKGSAAYVLFTYTDSVRGGFKLIADVLLLEGLWQFVN